MQDMKLLDVVPVHNTLGEGVIWDASRGAVWWTDINSRLIYRYQLQAKSLQQWSTPERLCCFGLVAGKEYVIAAFESGFAYFDPPSGDVQWLHRVEQDNPNTRLNDGRADRQGRFWAGSMVENAEPPSAAGVLYCVDQRLQRTTKIFGLSISNGLCWSPDSSYMYHTDTPTGRIDRYDFASETATLSNRTTFAKPQAGCWPDGSTVDAQGFVWNAQWGGSQVVRYSPDGQVDLVLSLPVSQPTCVAFGGPDLNLLFVTSARQGLDAITLAEEPDAGNLLIYATNTTGLAESHFKSLVANNSWPA